MKRSPPTTPTTTGDHANRGFTSGSDQPFSIIACRSSDSTTDDKSTAKKNNSLGMISIRAGLKMVPWDGYLKYCCPSPKG
ncbi:hypothetical protein Vadar_012964 [Vaccinium darrowii]|uniref:Uncharacterized protein n=1 Tax=Vaccinium darrowii TaxID=229202 RepID=A0ACB7YVG7_9ERIC|nr:hypothetical protein Vadar_012964 [Vaccinium darrowii]